MKRGEVYDARLDPVEGSEQRGSRPVVVVSRNAINEFSPVVSAAPCKKRLLRRLGELAPATMTRLNEALRIAFDLD